MVVDCGLARPDREALRTQLVSTTADSKVQDLVLDSCTTLHYNSNVHNFH